MDKFVIEKFVASDSFCELVADSVLEHDQRLLNERDLDMMCDGREKNLLFVRSTTDTNSGYFIEDDGRWDYGTREQAFNTIKRRV